MPLPVPYRYAETDFLAIPDSQNPGGYVYMRRPIDTRSNQLVSEERANELLRDYSLYGDLLTDLPAELGIRDKGGRMQTDWNTVLRQENGNIVSLPIVTGGYAQIKFPRTSSPAGFAVIEADLLPLLMGGTLGVEQLKFMAMAEATLLGIKAWTPAQWQQFKTMGLAQGVLCDCTDTDETGTTLTDTYSVVELYQLQTSTTSPTTGTNPTTGTTTPAPTTPKADPVVKVDIVTCELVAGWSADKAATGKPQPVDIYVNGQFEITVTPARVRTDVAKYLRDQGYQASDSSLFQWEYALPAKYRVGATNTVKVFASGTSIEAGYNAAQTTGICGVKPGGSSTPAPVYVIQLRLDGPPSLTATQTKGYWITERLSDDTQRRRTDAVTYSIKEGTIAGLSLTPTVNGAEVNLTWAGGDSTRKVTLLATTANGGSAEATIELVGNACQRPAGLGYKPQLVWNAVPASGGNARLFDTLADANATLGKHFDATAPLNLTGSTFPAEMANYNVGTEVFYRWSPAYTSCEHVSDGIYYVLGGNGDNSQKLAIQVVNGRIAAVSTSNYVTPEKPAAAGIPNSSLIGIAYGYTGSNEEYSGDLLVFAKNGTQPPVGYVDTNTAPTTGFSNGNQTLNDNAPMSSIDNYLNQTDQVPRWVSLLRAAKQAGYAYVGRGSGVDFPGETIQFRVRGNRTETGYADYSFVTPAYDVTVPLTQLYPAP